MLHTTGQKSLYRAATGGKAAKTEVLSGFCKVEHGRGSGGAPVMCPPLWRSCLPEICNGHRAATLCYKQVAGALASYMRLIDQIWFDPLRGFWATFEKKHILVNKILCAFFGLWKVFFASSSFLEVGGQKNYAHITTQRILNKVIQIKYSVGFMVWQWY